MNLVNLLDRQNQERQDKIDAQQQADAAHKFALQKYYGKEFDPNNFDTGTDLNKSINDALISGKKNLAEIINNPNSSDEDIDNAAQQALTPAMKLYQTGMAVKRNIDTSMEGLKGDKTLAPYLGSLKKQAYINALYTKDGDKVRLKNDSELSQLNPDQDYAGDILKNNPQLVVPGDVDVDGFLKGLPVANHKLNGAWYSSPGVKHKSNFEANTYQGVQKLVQDDKGAYSVQTANEPITTTDANGNKVQVNQIPQDVVSSMQSSPGAKAKLDVATMQYLAQHNISAEPNTPAFETAKRAMLYDVFDKKVAKGISQGQDVTTAPIVIKEQMGYPMPGSSKGSDTGDNNANISASFKDITDTPFTGSNGVQGTINNGTFIPKKPGAFDPLYKATYDPTTTMTGTIPIDKLPASVYHAAKAYIADNDITGETAPNDKGKETPTGFVKVKISNGQISSIKTDKGWFDVGDRTNANINTYNKTHGIKQKKDAIIPDASNKKTAEDYGL
jgi:hypothetical protein